MTGSSFNFDANKSTAENLEKFLDHLKSKDAEMAELFKDNIMKMIPLPEGQAKTSARKEFNKSIIEKLVELQDADSKKEDSENE